MWNSESFLSFLQKAKVNSCYLTEALNLRTALHIKDLRQNSRIQVCEGAKGTESKRTQSLLQNPEKYDEVLQDEHEDSIKEGRALRGFLELCRRV